MGGSFRSGGEDEDIWEAVLRREARIFGDEDIWEALSWLGGGGEDIRCFVGFVWKGMSGSADVGGP